MGVRNNRTLICVFVMNFSTVRVLLFISIILIAVLDFGQAKSSDYLFENELQDIYAGEVSYLFRNYTTLLPEKDDQHYRIA